MVTERCARFGCRHPLNAHTPAFRSQRDPLPTVCRDTKGDELDNCQCAEFLPATASEVLTRGEYEEQLRTMEDAPTATSDQEEAENKVLAHDAALRAEVERLTAGLRAFGVHRDSNIIDALARAAAAEAEVERLTADFHNACETGRRHEAALTKAEEERDEARANHKELYEEWLDAAKRYKSEIDAAEAALKKAEEERDGFRSGLDSAFMRIDALRVELAGVRLECAHEVEENANARDAAEARVTRLETTLRDALNDTDDWVERAAAALEAKP